MRRVKISEKYLEDDVIRTRELEEFVTEAEYLDALVEGWTRAARWDHILKPRPPLPNVLLRVEVLP